MPSKIRIRIGDTEIEYEGSDEFLKEELPDLLRTVTELHRVRAAEHAAPGKTPPPPASKALELTTGSIAAKLNVSAGSDLVMAAAARLTLGGKQDTFSRQTLLAEMKSASAYYEKNYSSNLSQYLKALLKADRLKETANNVFSLTPSARAELEASLANA